MNEKFYDFVRKYQVQHIAVAVSGGVDSVCLLHWCVMAGLSVTALHVNHGLRDAADVESRYVVDLCEKLGVRCKVFYWTDEKPVSGLEAAARDARYNMMLGWCRDNNIDALFVAHQADDQIETFLMNLSRGSGVSGLSAMRAVSYRDGVKIVRPLLSVYRAELISWCNTNGVQYFADEMNDDENYTRVKIRKNRHLLASKLGISDARILLAIENLGRARDALDGQAVQMVNQVLRDDYALFTDSFLFDVAPDIGLKFLGILIQKIGGDCYQPRLNSLNRALSNLKSNCQFTLGHCTVRRLNDKILVVPEGAKTSIRKRNEKYKRYAKK